MNYQAKREDLVCFLRLMEVEFRFASLAVAVTVSGLDCPNKLEERKMILSRFRLLLVAKLY
jgi:hypothetical protein